MPVAKFPKVQSKGTKMFNYKIKYRRHKIVLERAHFFHSANPVSFLSWTLWPQDSEAMYLASWLQTKKKLFGKRSHHLE